MANSLNKITTKSILDATVANADIADDAVTSSKLADNAVVTAAINADAVTSSKLADNAVVTAAINADAVTTAKIADDAVTADKLANAINTSIAGKAVLTGSTNQTITTVTGANAIAGNANLTYDGGTLTVKNTSSAGDSQLYLEAGEGGGAVISMHSDEDDDNADGWRIQNAGDSLLGFRTKDSGSWVQKMKIGNDGHVTIDDGNLVIGTAGHGIDFSATSSNGTSELLDDYEEGTWTPNLSTTASTTSHTQSAQFGAYTKIGNVVFCEFAVTWTGHTGAGAMMMRGLPFTSANDSNWTACVNISTVSNFGYGGADQVGIVEANSTNIYWKYHDTNGSHQIVIGATQQTGNIIGSFHYYT